MRHELLDIADIFFGDYYDFLQGKTATIQLFQSIHFYGFLFIV